MAGLLTHLIVSFVGFLLIWIIFKSWKYGIAFVFGHLVPDLISFGITGIRQNSADPGVIMTNSWFEPLALFSHNPLNWIIIITVVWVGLVLLYSFKKLSKEKFTNWILGLVLFLIGITLHLIIDKLILEVNYWI